MNRALRLLSILCLPPLLATATVRADNPPPLPEVLALLRSNLTSLTPRQLDEAAVQGLLERLQPRVFLLTNEPAVTPPPAATPLLSRTSIFESAIGYLRVDRVAAGLDQALAEGVATLTATNRLKGLVLDLRYTAGHDFQAAGKAADAFVSGAQPLLDWGDGTFASTGNSNACTLPLAILVNPETRGAAEALAAGLQEARAGLVIGRPTAGEAAVFRELPLSTGQRLRIAVAPVKVGRPGRALPVTGLAPDITLQPAPTDERKYYEDPFRPLPGTTPRAGAGRPTRLSEADLVRLHREGLDPASARSRRAEPPPPAPPTVTDPALIRALDLLKGLAVIESRQP